METGPWQTVNGFTWLDAVWGFFVVALALRGLLRGLVQELLEVVGLSVAAYAGVQAYRPLGRWLAEQIPELPEQAARAAAFALVAMLVAGVSAWATGMVVHLVRLSPLSWVDSLAGAAFGGLKGLAVVALLVVLVASFPDPALRQWVGDSRLSREVTVWLPRIWKGLEHSLRVPLPPLPALGPPPAPQEVPALPRRAPGRPDSGRSVI